MNFNTILFRLGLDPNDFINEDDEPIKTKEGFIYEVKQRTDLRCCPCCKGNNVIINDYNYVEINCSETDHIKDTLRIKKVRFKCKNCNKTFTPSLRGIERYSKISNQTFEMIVKDFYKLISFSSIAFKYGITRQRVLQIFDKVINFVPRKTMPFVLCVDEIKFNEEYDQKYACVLYDHDRKEIVDIIKNRQLGYLYEYFDKIPEKERKNTKYFVSDMYDGYKTVHKKYFYSAIHIVDIFHVITQLSRAVNKIRVKVMNELGKGSIEYSFMKSKWKYFLCRRENIPDKYFTYKATGEIYHFDQMIDRCIIKDNIFLEGYNILQDLFHYYLNSTFTESLNLIDSICERLFLTGNELLEDVGYTYKKWRIEIANGFARNQSGKHYTNGIAESINNHLKTIIKTAYGYHNFNRFRKRAMIILTYKKNPR